MKISELVQRGLREDKCFVGMRVRINNPTLKTHGKTGTFSMSGIEYNSLFRWTYGWNEIIFDEPYHYEHHGIKCIKERVRNIHPDNIELL